MSPARAGLILGALGVVFGDIGTSPIYTTQTVFDPGDPHPEDVTRTNVYGLSSMIVWSVALVVTVKYVLLFMRADNDGEGGIMALITLIRRTGVRARRTKVVLAGLGVFGASLFFGDSMITPAISVLSAVEGLKVVQPSMGHLVVPITVVIIVILFASQRYGSAVVGRAFGPVMVVWFASIGILGAHGIVEHPESLAALSPTWAVGYLFTHFGTAFFALAAVVLAITGAEALYADLGHFGRRPITLAWLWLVFPACILSYLGQGGLVLADPKNVASPFFLLTPHALRLPMVLLATAATVIASQAVITGAFSLTHQAVALGYLPRLRIDHTSEETQGQIYVPWVNWALLVAVVSLVLTFGSSASLAFAFGMAVTGTIMITTLLFFWLLRHRWHVPLWLVVGAGAMFLSIDVLFFAANLTKLIHGAWLPLAMGLVVFTIMTTWQRGRALVTAHRLRQEGSLSVFLESVRSADPPIQRVPRTAVFLNRGDRTTPLALRANVEHNGILHSNVVILDVQTGNVPYVADADRIRMRDLDLEGVVHVTARVGYAESPDVPALLALIPVGPSTTGLDFEDASYFLSTIDVHLGPATDMATWRQHLFLATSRLTTDAAEALGLPRERTLILGSRVEI